MNQKISAIFIILSFVVYGQSSIKNVFPPSPNNAALFQFTGSNVNLSSGIPSISIPVYSLSVDNLIYPIGLDYYAGGNKVNDISSNTGLGWSFTGKGVLTRVVKSLPDDASNGYMYNPNTTAVLKYRFENDPNLASEIPTIDTEPDLFMAKAGNLNISFYYDRSGGKFIQVPLTDNKIVPTIVGGKLQSWQIIDPVGNKYFFGTDSQIEYSQNARTVSITNVASEAPNEVPDFISSWYLTKIETPSGKNITFSYGETSQYVLSEKIEESKIISYDSNINLSHVSVPFRRNYAVRSVSEKQLTKIITGSLEINFAYGQLRKDLPASKTLDEIIVKRGNSQIRKAKLNTGYFVADPSFNFDPTFYSYYDEFRLKLSSVDIFEGSSTTAQKYSFTYNPISLPNRHSFSQDAWGYFNSKSNISLIPKTDFSDLIGVPVEVGDADRSVSEVFSQASILTNMRFPTGGSIEYIYELNDTDKILDLSYPYNFSSTQDYYVGFMPDVEITQTDVSVINKSMYEMPFTIENISSYVYFNSQNEGCNSNSFTNTGCNFYLKVKNLDTNTETPINQSEMSLKLSDGNYKLIAINRNINSSMQYGFNINLSYKAVVNEDGTSGAFGSEKTKIGGLRLKKYVLKNENGSEIMRNNYQYDINNKSAGTVSTYPVHIEKPYYTTVGNTYKISSNNLYSFANSGRPIYTKVTEFKTDANGTNLGKTENFFGVDDGSNRVLTQSSTLERNKSDLFLNWRNGNLLKQYIYNKDSEIVQEVQYSYSSKSQVQLENFGMVAEYRFTDSVPFYKMQFYPLFTESYSIDVKKITNYLAGRALHTSTEYFYSNPLHYQPTSEVTTFPDLSVLETGYQYAHEKGNQFLIGKNMVGIPLETTVTKKADAFSARNTIAKIGTDYPTSQAEADTKTSGLALPTAALSYDLQNNSVTEVTYDRYDSAGNLLQYTTKAGIPVAIIWGYQQTQPIAKIEGATYSQVSSLAATLISAADLDAVDPTKEGALISALDSFRTDPSMANFQITTYTYDPSIGVTSITPPSGIRELYQYDAANRLQSVLDVNGNILKEYKYNYKP